MMRLIESYIDNHLRAETRNEKVWENSFKFLMTEIQAAHKDGIEQVEILEQEGLTVNRIEAEGFLRGISCALKIIEDNMDSIDDSIKNKE